MGYNELEQILEEYTEDKIVVPEHQRNQKGRGKRQKLPESLPREEVIIDLADEDKICSEDGTQLKCIGEEVSERLDIIPAKIKVIREIRKKYACIKCDNSIKTASCLPTLFPKSIATPGLVSFIATSKYVDAIPLYRMESVLRRYGIEIPRNTMARWMINAAEKLETLMKIFEEELASSNYLHVDETTVQVLKEKDRAPSLKSYMWVVAREGPKPIVLFRYFPSRAGEIPYKLLEGFSGYLQCDGYSGYNKISRNEGVLRVGCWSHCRRYFHKAYKHSKSKGIGDRGLSYIKKLFKIEEQIKNKNSEEKLIVRNEKSREIILKMKEWLDGQVGKLPPKGYAGEAIHYALGEWENLARYLDDGKLSISNDYVERAIRPFTIGRKNWMFADTPNGAHSSATFYSLVETAKANGNEPYEYLKMVLEKLPYADSMNDYLALLPFEI